MIIGAKHIAGGDRTIENIAEETGVSERTIYRWKQEPLFQAKIAQYREAFAAEVFGAGIGNAVNRQRYRNTQAIAVQHVQQQRRLMAEQDPELALRGGRSGLIVEIDAQRVIRRMRCDACHGVGILHGGDCPHCGGTGTREITEREARYGFDQLIVNYMSMLLRDSADEEDRYFHPERLMSGAAHASATANVMVGVSIEQQLKSIPDWELNKIIAQFDAERAKVIDAQPVAPPEPEPEVKVPPPPEVQPEFERGPMNGKPNGFGYRGSKNGSG